VGGANHICVAELPQSPNGKVLKKDVREPFWRGRHRSIWLLL